MMQLVVSLQDSAESYGISAPLMQQLRQAVHQFQAAYETANNPTSRTKPALEFKDVMRDRAIEATRAVVRQVRAGVKDASRLDQLNLRTRKKKVRRVPVPARGPVVWVKPASGRQVLVGLSDADRPGRRARPRNAAGAIVLIARSPQPPHDRANWSYAAVTGKSACVIEVGDAIENGEPMWVSAVWISPTKQCSPMAAPVCTRLIDTIGAFNTQRLAS